MTWALLTGALTGLGVYALVRVFLRPRPGVATMIARIEGGQRSMSTHTITASEAPAAGLQGHLQGGLNRLADRLEVLAVDRGWELGGMRTDLALMGRTRGSHLATKVAVAVLLFLLAPVVWSVLRLAGMQLPTAVPALLAIGLAAFGFFMPDLALRSEAAQRREDFRRTVGVFLDLVAMNLAGGRGLPEALLAAATVSDHWTLVRIRQALANARLYGTTPWVALASHSSMPRSVRHQRKPHQPRAIAMAASMRLSASARPARYRV